jgi:hypothetical protein
VVIASWLLAVDVDRVDETRASLHARPGIECRSEAGGRLVVLSECPAGGLDAVHAQLRSAPGVRGAALVAALDDEEPQPGIGAGRGAR